MPGDLHKIGLVSSVVWSELISASLDVGVKVRRAFRLNEVAHLKIKIKVVLCRRCSIRGLIGNLAMVE